MEIYYKFESAKDFKSLSIDWHYTTVADLKHNIYYKKYLKDKRVHRRDNLIVTNAQTNEEYLDDETLISKNTSVIIRRVPLQHCTPIIITPVADPEKPLSDDVQATDNSFSGGDSLSVYQLEWDEKWKYLSMPEVVPFQGAINKAEEDSKIRALVDAPALDRQCFGAGRGFGHGMGGRSDMRGYGREGLLERITPPAGYICHRCNVPGHFIHHCPTNGDPAFEVKRTKPPTGIPKSMLMATQDGSYALSSGHFAVLKPNEDAFEKEIEGMPSTHSVRDLPAELYCPLCRAVMKDAVLVGKCCFKSFCDKCIRDYIISKSLCFCGATNVLADDLLPNKTVRGTIVRFLEISHSSYKRKVKHDDKYHAKHPHQHGEKECWYPHRSKSVLDSRPANLANALDLPSLPSGLQTEKITSDPDRKHNTSVFSSIISAEELSASSKKRKYDSASPSTVNRSSDNRSQLTTSNGDYKDPRKNAATQHDYESGDEDRHFKRKRSRYESSAYPAVKEGRCFSRGSREKGVIAAAVGGLSAY